jgi:pimeloyl-ACP methyl ester carboxylesterase
MELIEDLRNLTLPLLLFFWEKDQFQLIATAECFKKELPGAHLRVISDSDQLLPLEKA